MREGGGEGGEGGRKEAGDKIREGWWDGGKMEVKIGG